MSLTPSLTSKQITFFAKSGFLELEAFLTPTECDALHLALLNTLSRRPKEPIVQGRDLWRDTPPLKTLLLSRKLSSLVMSATNKTSLRLAFDQWFPSDFFLSSPTKLKDLFSVQGLACLLLIQLTPGQFIPPAKAPPLGLIPFPQGQGNILLLEPSLLLNWPALSTNLGLYCIGYANPNAVYVRNDKDPGGALLKKLGCNYGDVLSNATHPALNLA